MRLNIPVDTTVLDILKGPGTKRMLDASLEKTAMGYREPTGPRLDFTVINPIDLSPLKLTVEMIGNWDKVGDCYQLAAVIVGSGSYVTVKYWLQDAGFGLGSITDVVTDSREV